MILWTISVCLCVMRRVSLMMLAWTETIPTMMSTMTAVKIMMTVMTVMQGMMRMMKILMVTTVTIMMEDQDLEVLL